jgi:5-methylcytosine-specific restriction endonuclease McrA
MDGAVVLLNADYTPLSVVKLRRAIKLIMKKKAVVVQATGKILENAEKTFSLVVPKVIRLVEYVKALARTAVVFTRRNVFIRDGHTCAYCGCKPEKLTLDHIIPVSRGGRSDFKNCVTACLPCNNRKDDRTPDEAGMKLKIKPKKPSVMEFVIQRMKSLGVTDEIDLGWS